MVAETSFGAGVSVGRGLLVIMLWGLGPAVQVVW